MVDRDRRLERPRTDKGRFASKEEIEAAQREKTDAAMNRWIVSRVRGPNSKRAQLARKLFGNPKGDKK
jgi:hypothetical protein